MNAAVYVAIAVALIALYQAWQARRTFTADHERRKKQATMDAWDTCRDRCSKELALIWDAYRTSPTLNEEQAGAVYAAEGEMKERRVILQQYLNNLERFAVGVRLGIYDLDVADEIGRGAIIGARDRFRAFVLVARRDSSDRLYEAQWWLAEELERRSKPKGRIPKGRIRKS